MLEIIPKNPFSPGYTMLLQDDEFGLYNFASNLVNRSYISEKNGAYIKAEFKNISKKIVKVLNSPVECLDKEICLVDILKDNSRKSDIVIPLGASVCFPPDKVKIQRKYLLKLPFLTHNNINKETIRDVIIESDNQLYSLVIHYNQKKQKLIIDNITISSNSEPDISIFSKHCNISGVNVFFVTQICYGEHSQKLRSKQDNLAINSNIINEQTCGKFVFIKKNIESQINLLLE